MVHFPSVLEHEHKPLRLETQVLEAPLRRIHILANIIDEVPEVLRFSHTRIKNKTRPLQVARRHTSVLRSADRSASSWDPRWLAEWPPDSASTDDVLSHKPPLHPNPSRDTSEGKQSPRWASDPFPQCSGDTPNDSPPAIYPGYERTRRVSRADRRDRSPSPEAARAQSRRFGNVLRAVPRRD